MKTSSALQWRHEISQPYNVIPHSVILSSADRSVDEGLFFLPSSSSFYISTSSSLDTSDLIILCTVLGCVCHMSNRIVITEYVFLKWYTLFQLIRDILGYTKVCSIFTIIGLI